MLATWLVTSAEIGARGVMLNPGGCLSWIVVGLLAGWLAGHVVRGRGFGCLGDILLGLVGAFIGALIVSYLPVQVVGPLGFFGSFVVAFLGAFVLAVVGRMLGGPQRRRYDW